MLLPFLLPHIFATLARLFRPSASRRAGRFANPGRRPFWLARRQAAIVRSRHRLRPDLPFSHNNPQIWPRIRARLLHVTRFTLLSSRTGNTDGQRPRTCCRRHEDYAKRRILGSAHKLHVPSGTLAYATGFSPTHIQAAVCQAGAEGPLCPPTRQPPAADASAVLSTISPGGAGSCAAVRAAEARAPLAAARPSSRQTLLQAGVLPYGRGEGSERE